MPPAAANCLLCRHFVVTWDVAEPRGCRFYGFKSREYPSSVVLRASGSPCAAFEPKPGPPAARDQRSSRPKRSDPVSS